MGCGVAVERDGKVTLAIAFEVSRGVGMKVGSGVGVGVGGTGSGSFGIEISAIPVVAELYVVYSVFGKVRGNILGPKNEREVSMVNRQPN